MIHGIAPDTLPMLHLREIGDGFVRIAAIVVRRSGRRPPDLLADGRSLAPRAIGAGAGAEIWRYDVRLPAGPKTGYTFEGRHYHVTTEFGGDLTIAYTSCNGQEHGDLDRPVASRNALWRQLAERNTRDPIHLLLQGGDQIYADEVTGAHALSRDWPDVTDRRLSAAEMSALRDTLFHAFVLRYATQAAQPGYAEVAARIPSLAMWDDHDICDGWGSLPARALDSGVGRCLFAAARDAFKLFQMGCGADERPELALGDGHLSWRVSAPGLTLIAPDLRSTRRPDRVMDDPSWSDLDRAFAAAGPGHLFVLSSVPALGPRLSLVERMMQLTNRMERYEDDLRDQWQSRAHREEWKRFLGLMLDRHRNADTPVTVLSGEIHLATRGTMDCASGPLHQLVASGISHPEPPRAYARGLGALARLGEAPLPDHPIRLRALPGRRTIYTAQRNYLLLNRRNGDWSARWALEKSGLTPPLPI